MIANRVKVGRSGKMDILISTFVDHAGLTSVEITQGTDKVVIPNTKLSDFLLTYQGVVVQIDEDET